MQFMDISETPYALIADQHRPHPHPVEDTEVNPSASLNDWLMFLDSQEMEVL
jgi:hypothetical protein